MAALFCLSAKKTVTACQQSASLSPPSGDSCTKGIGMARLLTLQTGVACLRLIG